MSYNSSVVLNKILKELSVERIITFSFFTANISLNFTLKNLKKIVKFSYSLNCRIKEIKLPHNF